MLESHEIVMAPTKIRFLKQSQQLEVLVNDTVFLLSAEFLRVHSPSAEVKGHGPGQAVLQYGKRDVAIKSIERAGNYALKLTFSDGHDSGIYTWDYLQQLGQQEQVLWQA